MKTPKQMANEIYHIVRRSHVGQVDIRTCCGSVANQKVREITEYLEKELTNSMTEKS